MILWLIIGLASCVRHEKLLMKDPIDPVVFDFFFGSLEDIEQMILAIDETALKRTKYYTRFKVESEYGFYVAKKKVDPLDAIDRTGSNYGASFSTRVLKKYNDNEYLMLVLPWTGGSQTFCRRYRIKIEYVYFDNEKAYHRIINLLESLPCANQKWLNLKPEEKKIALPEPSINGSTLCYFFQHRYSFHDPEYLGIMEFDEYAHLREHEPDLNPILVGSKDFSVHGERGFKIHVNYFEKSNDGQFKLSLKTMDKGVENEYEMTISIEIKEKSFVYKKDAPSKLIRVLNIRKINGDF